ncbi:MAG: hypothetical protein PUF61_04325 [Spirochaetales bacterium]|nr:hypothetical protein [Spirochaetales bacterium]
MKKVVISVFVLMVSVNAFASGKIDTKVMQHPLVESCHIDTSNDCFGWAFTVKLKNGHEIYFDSINSDLTFGKWSGIRYINDVYFGYVEYKDSVKTGGYSYLRIRDFCKATETYYNDFESILNDYNEFCRLLNLLPYVSDDSAKKICAKYSEKKIIELHRYTDKLIEIPEK